MIPDKKQTVSEYNFLVVRLIILWTVSCVCQREAIILCTCHTARAYLIHWKEEDSVSVIRRDDMIEQVSEPAVDVVKVKFQHQVCEGVLAEVGTLRAMNAKEEAFLNGEYTPFSRRRQASPPESPSLELTNAKRAKRTRRMLHLKEVDVDEDEDKGGEIPAEAEELADVVEDVVGRVVVEVDEAHDLMV